MNRGNISAQALVLSWKHSFALHCNCLAEMFCSPQEEQTQRTVTPQQPSQIRPPPQTHSSGGSPIPIPQTHRFPSPLWALCPGGKKRLQF